MSKQITRTTSLTFTPNASLKRVRVAARSVFDEEIVADIPAGGKAEWLKDGTGFTVRARDDETSIGITVAIKPNGKQSSVAIKMSASCSPATLEREYGGDPDGLRSVAANGVEVIRDELLERLGDRGL